ncbi:MAG: anti-sigma factor [Actinomycetota bacterium]
MSGARDHRRWRADLSAYLLGSLEAEETEALEGHLEACQRCRDELRWLQPAIDMIGESVPQLEPPPGLRARLMAEVRADAAELSPDTAQDNRRRDAPSRRSGGFRAFFWRPAVALTAVALIGAVIGGYALRGGGGDGTTTVDTQGASLAYQGDSGTLEMTGLRQLPKSDVYQAWVQRNHRIVPSSLFDAGRNGKATAAIPHHLDGANAVMVTVEPRGGSKQPSSSPVVSVPLPG